jgi:hypothetical protein
MRRVCVILLLCLFLACGAERYRDTNPMPTRSEYAEIDSRLASVAVRMEDFRDRIPTSAFTLSTERGESCDAYECRTFVDENLKVGLVCRNKFFIKLDDRDITSVAFLHCREEGGLRIRDSTMKYGALLNLAVCLLVEFDCVVGRIGK